VKHRRSYSMKQIAQSIAHDRLCHIALGTTVAWAAVVTLTVQPPTFAHADTAYVAPRVTVQRHVERPASRDRRPTPQISPTRSTGELVKRALEQPTIPVTQPTSSTPTRVVFVQKVGPRTTVTVTATRVGPTVTETVIPSNLPTITVTATPVEAPVVTVTETQTVTTAPTTSPESSNG
jgi:hypothetical protein